MTGSRQSRREDSRGMVYLVGAGPGDPGLITVRGNELLERCDDVVYDALVSPALIETIQARGGSELHYVGKRGGDEASTRQEDINSLLVELARRGRRVVRLKGGDPFVFGRGSEEAQALHDAGLPFEIVPGVTAGIAAPAYAGIPVTHRGLATSVSFVTGHEDPAKQASQTDWRALARAGGTIVLYMGVKRLPEIAAALVDGGMPGEIPAAAIQWGTLPRQRTVVATLETLAERAAAAGISAPVVTVIGWSVVLRDEIAWFDRRPLSGRRIVVTRPERGSALGDRLRDLGADVIEMPATRIEPLDLAPLAAALLSLDRYHWLVLTSQNAARIVWEMLRTQGRDVRALAGVKIAAVGPSTAEALLGRGIAVDVVPERYVAEGVLDTLGARDDVHGTRVLYATSEGARDVLPTGLREMGALVDVLPIYRSVPAGEGADSLKRALDRGEVDLITFTSASTVQGFIEAVGAERARKAPAASIGPVTTDAARKASLPVSVEATTSTTDGLVDAIVDHMTVDSAR